ncbi:cation/multidrug efflux pump [Thermanaerovibrio velox DSM 12556]|uniref:Cation/multidrug efflux pump n=1 Tax=Thermanaerovibrio velox DSM 12556 TaxID=926567 RepID=H0UMT1_9BACT|nr:efflux RND transporter permease subunit [Thermanaerovibrio velox]EHM09226.1 cation/multidrug efflux pump [Thermanaerovibrio velox DSM 12556]
MALHSASLRRPVAMGCLLIALTLLGMNAYRKMGVELMPKVDAPFITVMAIWPGASPRDIETDVAKKIEDAVSSVDGIKHIKTTCMENVAVVGLEFEMGTDVDAAANDVREKLDPIVPDLPEGVEKPIIQKFDINASPVVTMALVGDMPVDELYDYVDRKLKDRFSTLPGVAEVRLTGGSKRELHVLLDRFKLAQRGLTSYQVTEALAKGVRTVPSGRIKEGEDEEAVRFDGDYRSLGDLMSMPLVSRGGAMTYLKDVADVRFDVKERRQAVFLDGKQAIGIQIVKKSDANAVALVDRVREVFRDLQGEIPGGTKLVWVTDEGSYIRSSVNGTISSIIQGIALTAGILFLFLYNLRSTIVVAVSMPLTILMSMFFMNLLGYSLNTSTLLALGLSVGILVSNSLVVLESVLSKLKETQDPMRAAMEGTGEVLVAVLASAGTNVVVLLPIGLMGSIVGEFFRPFAITSLIVNAMSIFISFTLTPILSAFLLKATSGGRLERLEARFNQALSGIADRYVDMVKHLIKRRGLATGVLILVAVLFVHSITLMPKIGFSFAPTVDKGNVYVKLEFPTRQNLDATVQRVAEAEGMLRGLPHLNHVYSTIGRVEGIGENEEGVYLAQMLLNFSQKTQRDLSIFQLLDLVRQRMKSFPGAKVTVSVPSFIGGQNIPIQMDIMGEDFDELDRIALEVQKHAQGMEGFVDTDTSVREGKREILVRPNRPVLADMGLSPLAIGAVMRNNLEGEKGAVFKTSEKNYDIRVKFKEEPGSQQVESFQIPLPGGSTIPLAAVARVSDRVSPIKVYRSDKMRTSKFFSDLVPGYPLGTAVKNISQAIEAEGLLPPGYKVAFRGDYERMADANEAFAEAGILSVILTFLALSAILESFKWPVLILTTVPLGLTGVLWALWITGTPMNIFVLLGVVMLIGIVVNNAILVVEEFRSLRSRSPKADPEELMLTALRDSFRPVLMVTLAAVLGMLPLAVSRGMGSEFTNGIGIASAGGVAMSGALALFVVPLIYMVRQEWKGRKDRESQANGR